MKPRSYTAAMKWIWALLLLVLVVVASLYARTERDADAPSGGARGAPPARVPGPEPELLTAGSPAPQGSGPEPADDAVADELPPGTVRLRDGTFTPLDKLVVSSKEEREQAERATRDRLQAAKPLRATWSDVPLPQVLKELSELTGLTIALGPDAVQRGESIRVTAPLADQDPQPEPTVWNVLEAIARRHQLTLRPWEGGVLLRVPKAPEQVTVRIHALQDLLQVEWGSRTGIEEADRLLAVFLELLRGAASVGEETATKLHGTNMVVRAPNAAHDRIEALLERWRDEPARFQDDYLAFVARRHPTVSGAPSRGGASGDAGR